MGGGEGISTNILTDRLEQLVAHGIVEKVQRAADRRQNIYQLTEKGIDLVPVLLEMALWGARYEETDAPTAVIREMESNRDDFLVKVRKKWEEDRRRLDAEASDDQR
jgi:DNA-binding HxlR family transcriptional regulator